MGPQIQYGLWKSQSSSKDVDQGMNPGKVVQSGVFRYCRASGVPRTSLVSSTAAGTEVPRSNLCSNKVEVCF